MTANILATTEGALGWLTLNNPARHNAISISMWDGIARALQDFEADPSVRVVILRGTGGKAFASGADISEFDGLRDSAAATAEYDRRSAAGKTALDNFPKPMIAMIEGYCLGGGMGVAAAADLRIAGQGARFGIPAGRLGLGYGFGSITRLLPLIGPSVLKSMIFTAARLTAAEAQVAGFVQIVVTEEELEHATRALAESIAVNAPLTLQAAKYATAQALMDPQDRDMAGVSARLKACFDSADYAEGRAAFATRRPPVFRGE